MGAIQKNIRPQQPKLFLFLSLPREPLSTFFFPVGKGVKKGTFKKWGRKEEREERTTAKEGRGFAEFRK